MDARTEGRTRIFARSALYVRECKIRRCPSVRPSVRKIIDFCEGYVGGWTLLYTLGSLNYEFGGFWKKLKQKPSKTTISLWLRHVQGPVLGPVLDLFCGPFFKTKSLKGCSKATVFQACKWGLGQGLRSWRGWRRPNVGVDSGSYSNSVVALSNVKMASRPCLARWYLVINIESKLSSEGIQIFSEETENGISRGPKRNI